MRYSIDTNAIIGGRRRYYPPDVFPSLWDKIDLLVDSGELIATEEVLNELAVVDDEIHDWARNRKQMFVPLDEQIQNAVAQIMSNHAIVDMQKQKSICDPFVIALAQIKNCTVITYETPTRNPQRPRIPDVCAALGIEHINFLQFIKQQQWRF